MKRIASLIGAVSALVLSAVADETADTFTWKGGTAAWYGSGNWTPTDTERTEPGIQGDKVYIPSGGQVELDGTASVDFLRLTSAKVSTGEGTGKLVARSADGTSYARFEFYNNAYIGVTAADGANLTLELQSPLFMSAAQGGAKTNRGILYCKVTGGSAENPKPIRISKSEAGYNYGFHFFANADNDWVGDVELYAPHGNDNIAFETYLGFADVSATDSMLGNPANEILFDYFVAQWKSGQGTYGENRLYLNNIDSEGLKRKVHGTGIIGGQTRNASFTVAACPLVLGEGFMADPALYKQGVKESDYGTQGITGSSITMKPGALLVFDVDIDAKGNLKYDRILFTSSAAPFELTGSIVVREAKPLEEGTVIPAMTLAASAPSCTINPSAITPGWECSAVEDEAGGWTLNLVKAKSEPVVQAGGSSELGPDTATVSANVVSLGSAGVGELVVYYGQTDGGLDVSAWSGRVSYGEISAAGAYQVTLSNLALGYYFFRPAVIVNGTATLAELSGTFETVPVATPSSFVWRRIESNWDEDGDGAVPWERLSQVYARKVPGYAGDRIRFELWGYWNSNNIDYGSNAVLRLDHDVAIGNIDVTGGYGHHIRFLAESGTPVFSFDNNGQPSIFEIDAASEVSFGAQDNSLVMNLNNPVTIRRGGSYGFNLNFYAQITGGDSEHPSDLIIEQNANEWGNLYGRLLNSANTFTGNIILKRVNKGYLTFYVGSAAYPAENGMLGADSNEIRMSNGPTLVFCGSSTVVPSCSRTVRGRGTLTARNGDNKMALALGSAAVLAPCGDNDAGYGTMAVAATTLADDAGTTYAIDIDATDTAVADVLDFTGSSFERLNGRFTVTPSDETVKIPIGATWTIGKLPSGFSADVRFVSGNKNFTVHSAENESGEMVIVAERRQAGTMIIVR